MTQTWDTTKISDLLTSTFTASSSSKKSRRQASAPPETTIDVLLTFDEGGVSGHPNHASLYRGARAFAASLARPGWAPPLHLYTLTSVPLWRKYSFFLDALWTLLAVFFGVVVHRGRGSGPRTAGASGKTAPPQAVLSMSGLVAAGGAGAGRGHGAQETYGTARRAMTEAHKSQMVWFRWFWILFSRYMYINDLRLVRIKS